MKRIIIGLFFSLTGLSLIAQDFVSSFLDKCEEKDSLEIVVIGKKMLELINTTNSENKELDELLSGLENIGMINTKDSTWSNEYYSLAVRMLKTKSHGFKEVFSLQGSDENLLLMTKENKGVIKELVLLTKNEFEFSIISLSGDINLEKLAKYSKELNIKELDNVISNIKN